MTHLSSNNHRPATQQQHGKEEDSQTCTFHLYCFLENCSKINYTNLLVWVAHNYRSSPYTYYMDALKMMSFLWHDVHPMQLKVWYAGGMVFRSCTIRCATTQTASPVQTNNSPSLLSGVAPSMIYSVSEDYSNLPVTAVYMYDIFLGKASIVQYDIGLRCNRSSCRSVPLGAFSVLTLAHLCHLNKKSTRAFTRTK